MTPELMDTLAVAAFALGVLLSIVAFIGMVSDGKNMMRWPFWLCVAAFVLILLAKGLHQSNAPIKDTDGAIAPRSSHHDS